MMNFHFLSDEKGKENGVVEEKNVSKAKTKVEKIPPIMEKDFSTVQFSLQRDGCKCYQLNDDVSFSAAINDDALNTALI